MDANIVNPFIEATLHVLDTTASTKIKAKDPYLKKGKTANGDISGIIDISGDFKGSVAISFSEKAILGVVSNMFGEEMTEMNDEIKDAIGEIANMISGRVTTKLVELGKSLSAKLSTVHMGKNHEIDHLSGYPVVAIPFITPKGGFTIEICFEQ